MTIVPYLLAVLVLIGAGLLKYRELRARGSCPHCGADFPQSLGKWGGVRQYVCRKCDLYFDALDVVRTRKT